MKPESAQSSEAGSSQFSIPVRTVQCALMLLYSSFPSVLTQVRVAEANSGCARPNTTGLPNPPFIGGNKGKNVSGDGFVWSQWGATRFGAGTLSPLVHRKSARAANYARLVRLRLPQGAPFSTPNPGNGPVSPFGVLPSPLFNTRRTPPHFEFKSQVGFVERSPIPRSALWHSVILKRALRCLADY
jgi:hypothetical protein